MNLTVLSNDTQLTMSSLDIAELTGKRHDHVLRDIRNMLENLELDAPHFWGTQTYGHNNTREVCNLPKRETLILVSGYNIQMRAKIIDRWQELEAKVSLPPVQPKAILHPIEITSAISLAIFPVLKSYGIDHNSAVLSANRTAKEVTGYDILALGNVQLEAPNQKQLPMTVTELGKLKSVSANGMNKLLEQAGLQVKVNSEWTPTDKANGFFKLLDTSKKHSNGTPITQLKWYEEVLSKI